MLTPAATDLKRAEEIKRRDAKPTEFGTERITNLPKDWKETPLKAAIKTPAK